MTLPYSGDGRKHRCFLRGTEGILWKMWTGAQWRELPSYYGKPTTVHGWMCKFEKVGIFDRLWKAILEWADAWSEVSWERQYVDGSLIKAPRGGSKIGKSRLHKWRIGSNRSVLVDGHGDASLITVC